MMNLLLNHWLLLTRSNMMRLCNLLLYPMRLSSKLLLLLSHLLLGHLMMGHLLLNNLLLGCMMLGCILLCCGMIHLRHTTTSWMELLLLLWVSTLWLELTLLRVVLALLLLELTLLRLVLALLLLELTLLMLWLALMRLELTLVLLRWHSLVARNTLVLGPLRWHMLVLGLPLVLRGHGTAVVLLVRVLQLKVRVLLLELAQIVLGVHLLFIQALPSFILLKITPVGHVQKLLVA